MSYTPGLQIEPVSSQYQNAPNYDSMDGASGAVKSGAGIGAGIATAMGQPWAAPLILLGGSILSSLFSKPERVPLTPDQIWYRDMVKFYSNLGKKANQARKIARIAGIPEDKVQTIGYPDTRRAFEAIGVPASVKRQTPGTTKLYDEEAKPDIKRRV